MLRNSFFTIALLLTFFSAKAQFVTIPDLNFVYYLSNSNFSGCMNGNQLDTTCNAVLNDTIINCPSHNIYDLTGISYFKNLKILNCNFNHISFLPSLPGTLTSLWCQGNQMNGTLPPLPASLSILLCDDNLLDSLPALPPNLIDLGCFSNNLTSLPALPSTLTDIRCSNNFLNDLPTLPQSLTSLRCENNILMTLPSLPTNLIHLICFNNQLTFLPALPSALIYLNCFSNQLTSLPNLPNSLNNLSCYDNQLTFLPPLPDSLISMDVRYNQLATLPTLPNSLIVFLCGNNQITILPDLHAPLLAFDCSNNLLDSLPTLPVTIIDFGCANNFLNSLPALPPNLQSVECSFNQLLSIPPFPSSLRSLKCAFNQLVNLPDLPDTLDFLNINANQNITCLPSVKYITNEFQWISTGITCLPNVINFESNATVTPSISNVPICDLINVNNCEINWNIQGSVYSDDDQDCIFDSVEDKHGNIKINLFSGGNLVQQTFSDALGRYTFAADTGLYSDVVDTTGMPFLVDCPISGNYVTQLTLANAYQENNDFAIDCKPGFDIGVSSVVRHGSLRPGDTTIFNVLTGDMNRHYNLHCAIGISGSVTIVINGPVSYNGIVGSAITPIVNGDTLIYTIADFDAVNFSKDFRFKLHIDTNAQLGSQICFDVTVTPSAGDYNASNNYYSHCFTVVNSFDPNEKEVSPSGATDTSQYWLTYTIHFQNTGNAPAQHIYVLDTLDANIDESSIQISTYSHEPMVQVIGNLVRFNFPNINLPDSVNDEPNSHGYVQYKVKRKENLPVGTQIRNTAYIYFDFNAPVQTNTTLNQITTPTVGVASINKDKTDFTIYPNPLSSGRTLNLFFNVKSKTASLSIYEISGRKVFSKMILSSGQSQQINLPALAPGIYQCVLNDANGVTNQKLVIVK